MSVRNYILTFQLTSVSVIFCHFLSWVQKEACLWTERWRRRLLVWDGHLLWSRVTLEARILWLLNFLLHDPKEGNTKKQTQEFNVIISYHFISNRFTERWKKLLKGEFASEKKDLKNHTQAFDVSSFFVHFLPISPFFDLICLFFVNIFLTF